MIVYTDGAASKNGKEDAEAGCAYIIMDNNYNLIKGRAMYKKGASNNQMELSSVIASMYQINENDGFDNGQDKEINIYSDSEYVVNTATKWIFNWQKQGILHEKANSDYWTVFLEVKQWLLDKGYKINFYHVRGHADNKYNNICDEYAVEAYKQKKNLIIEEI